MRLGSCVAVELALGASIAAAVGGASIWTARQLNGEFGGSAFAASAPPTVVAKAEVGEPALILPLVPPIAVPVTVPVFGAFDGHHDADLLAPLRTQELVGVKLNRGGSSISIRMEFADGSRAAFKPQQTNMQTVPRREVAAYRIDRLLKLGGVPPAVGRSFQAEELFNLFRRQQPAAMTRLREQVIRRDGIVHGELSWWIPSLSKPKVNRYRLDEVNGVVTWKRYLRVGQEIPAEANSLMAQLSGMVLFDFLINNPDRWSGGNANGSGDGSRLYFMDNTMSFGVSRGIHRKVRGHLERVQKFSRSLVARLRSLNEDTVRQALESDRAPFERLLTEQEIVDFFVRRDEALHYIDTLIQAHGEEAVLVFP